MTPVVLSPWKLHTKQTKRLSDSHRRQIKSPSIEINSQSIWLEGDLVKPTTIIQTFTSTSFNAGLRTLVWPLTQQVYEVLLQASPLTSMIHQEQSCIRFKPKLLRHLNCFSLCALKHVRHTTNEDLFGFACGLTVEGGWGCGGGHVLLLKLWT